MAGRDYHEHHVHQYSAPPVESDQPSRLRRTGPLRVAYTAIRPLRPGWEARLQDAADKVIAEHEVGVLCDPTVDPHEASDVDLLVILYGTAHHPTAQVDAHTAAMQFRGKNPDARILVAACDFAEESPSTADLCTVVRGWSLGGGSWDAAVFMTLDEFGEWIFDHLAVAIRTERRHGRWPMTRRPVDVVREDFPGGGAGW